MSQPGKRYAEPKKHEFCLGTGPVTGASQLHALLRSLAPANVDEPWYDRAPLNERGGKAYLTIRSFYHSHLIDAALRWDEPVVGQES